MPQLTLILDLDETIFRTASMDARAFDPFFTHLRNALSAIFSSEKIKQITDDLWLYTWDKVIDKHKIPMNLFYPSVKLLDALQLGLNIAPFPDYRFVKKIPCEKFLVTTSLTSLQNKKIDALGIRDDFREIFINDTFIAKKNKQDVFAELVDKYDIDVRSTIVIGDNSESEISAGNALGMITVQVVREGIKRGSNAHYHIPDFSKLEEIIKKFGY